MDYEPNPASAEATANSFQELSAQRFRGKLLFRCYLADDDEEQTVDEYYEYYAEEAAS